MCLTPEQYKEVQKHRVDSGKTFVGGLTATEYPTILFDFHSAVPRGSRQKCVIFFCTYICLLVFLAVY